MACAEQLGSRLTEVDVARLKRRTTDYNRGGIDIRTRDSQDKARLFKLQGPAPVYDGAGRLLGTTEKKKVLLNYGAVKRMTVEDRSAEFYYFAWRSGSGSGFIPRSAFVDPPSWRRDPERRNPRPPGVSKEPLTIDAASAKRQLAGLRYKNWKGEFTTGNQGTDFAARRVGPHHYIYLLFAAPNVAQGGGAKDSLPDGSEFIQALDARGRAILERATMYVGKDESQVVRVTFLYGRAPRTRRYGWIARANVGRR